MTTREQRIAEAEAEFWRNAKNYSVADSIAAELPYAQTQDEVFELLQYLDLETKRLDQTHD